MAINTRVDRYLARLIFVPMLGTFVPAPHTRPKNRVTPPIPAPNLTLQNGGKYL